MCAAIQVCRYFNGVVAAMLDLAYGKPPKGHPQAVLAQPIQMP